MITHTVRETVNRIKTSLSGIFPDGEIQEFCAIIFEHLLNYSKIDIHLNQNKGIPDEIIQQIENITDQLKNHKPIQYILGKTTFYGFPFKVNDSVLIPRQETEELVRWIIDDWKNKSCSILDIGTGSGCIALSLSKTLAESKVTAMDISSEALKIASENADLNDCRILFSKSDILAESKKNISPAYNVVVSNPPYVCESEKDLMHRNVLGYEPSLALFVNDNDPLIFYRAIAGYSRKALKPGGNLYVEINERFGNEVVDIFKETGFKNIELRKDINGKDRIVRAIKSN